MNKHCGIIDCYVKGPHTHETFTQSNSTSGYIQACQQCLEHIKEKEYLKEKIKCLKLVCLHWFDYHAPAAQGLRYDLLSKILDDDISNNSDEIDKLIWKTASEIRNF